MASSADDKDKPTAGISSLRTRVGVFRAADFWFPEQARFIRNATPGADFTNLASAAEGLKCLLKQIDERLCELSAAMVQLLPEEAEERRVLVARAANLILIQNQVDELIAEADARLCDAAGRGELLVYYFGGHARTDYACHQVPAEYWRMPQAAGVLTAGLWWPDGEPTRPSANRRCVELFLFADELERFLLQEPIAQEPANKPESEPVPLAQEPAGEPELEPEPPAQEPAGEPEPEPAPPAQEPANKPELEPVSANARRPFPSARLSDLTEALRDFEHLPRKEQAAEALKLFRGRRNQP